MSNTVTFEDRITVPFIHGWDEFCAWVHSPQFPQTGRIDYLTGSIEVDMSPEDLFSHGSLKIEVASAIHQRVRQLDCGSVWTDSTRVSCPEAGVSSEPDIVYLSHQAVESQRVRLVPKASGDRDRFVEIEGAPDLIVEIVSDSSVEKDTHRLPPLYFQAGVLEWWLIDARSEQLRFTIHRRGSDGFAVTKSDADGFQRSEVLDCWYRLDRDRDALGWPRFVLSEKS
ncbi:MAG: Uma2 family endonuclease [Planctomycetota bacterium]|nr:Uma2 family endonuclease [Planctomycetota bacterium]